MDIKDPEAMKDNLREKWEQAKLTAKEHKKKYSNLKTRVEGYEKRIASMNEEEDPLFVRVVTQNVQYALNKMELVEKNVTMCNTHLKQFETEFKNVQKMTEISYTDRTNIQHRLSLYLSRFSEQVPKVENDLRIANKHLDKIVQHIRFLMKINRVPKTWKRK